MTKLWACNTHLFPSALAICASVRVYLDEQRITAQDIERIVAKLLQPGARARHKFAADLIADLSRMVADQVSINVSRESLAKMSKPTVNVSENLKLGDLFKTE